MCVQSVCMDTGLSKLQMERLIAKKRGPLVTQAKRKDPDFQTLTKLEEVEMNRNEHLVHQYLFF